MDGKINELLLRYEVDAKFDCNNMLQKQHRPYSWERSVSQKWFRGQINKNLNNEVMDRVVKNDSQLLTVINMF